MDNTEAIERIRKLRLAAQGTAVGAKDYRPIVYAFDIAEKAIEKQIPKKPINAALGYGDEVIITAECPNCHEVRRFFLPPRYCAICGQALDWSDKI